jgi:hypothetical protein
MQLVLRRPLVKIMDLVGDPQRHLGRRNVGDGTERSQ